MYHLAGWIVLKSGFFGSHFLEAVAIGFAYTWTFCLWANWRHSNAN